MRAASCPPQPLAVALQLSIFSKTLFYARENYPQDIAPRSRELLIGALEAISREDSGVLIELEQDPSPRWVTLTRGDHHCTLDLERVDAPWSLRSRLQEALRFVLAYLTPAPTVESDERLTRLEIAATNGMLSALDRHSRLMDPETYRQVRANLRPTSGAAGTGPGALRAQDSPAREDAVNNPWVPSFPQAARGRTVRYLRLPAFPAGVSGEVEGALVACEGAPPKGFILDLRDNSGGLLEEAVGVADAFIKAGTLGSFAGRRQHKDYVARADGHEPSGALVVLVNRRTAAAAEFVAAAVKNLGRGIVVGEPTAGAGMIDQMFDIPRTRRRDPPKDRDVVQNVIDNVPPPKPVDELEGDPFGLYLATGRLLAAGGAEIERAGVQPDVEMAWPSGEGSRADGDCVRQFGEAVIARARDAERSTLLSTAKSVPAEAACRSAGLRGL